jgi:hypothetical protein
MSNGAAVSLDIANGNDLLYGFEPEIWCGRRDLDPG